MQGPIAQDGTQSYALVYYNNGNFFLRTFGRQPRSKEEIEANELNLNQLFDLDDKTSVIDQLVDPFITCAFIDANRLFINFYYNYTK